MKESTLRLQSLIHESISRNGAISYADFMEIALYHPELGYYSSPDLRTGKSGDFFTSVSVGNCFGKILASRILDLWKKNTPQPLHLIEAGANNGQLAKDILDHLAEIEPALYSSIQYHIIEPLETLRPIQLNTLANHQDKITHHTAPFILADHPLCIFLSNELIDSFPFHLVQFLDGKWNELFVTSTANSGFEFCPREINFSHQLPSNLSNGYLTEWRSNIDSWIKKMANISSRMHTIFIDYGHIQDDYYHPSRTTGTHRTYHQHTATESLLELAGEQDITAHVNFSQLSQSLEKQGFSVMPLTSQASYLTHHGKSYLMRIEELFQKKPQKAASQIQQFKTLTTTLGHSFQVLEASR